MHHKLNVYIFEKNPEFAKKRNNHKLFREVLVHQLVQPFLDLQSEREVQVRGRPSVVKTKRKIEVDDDVRLSGKHYASKKYPRRKCCCCAYKINKHTGKRTHKRTNNFCETCEKYICPSCFKNFHSKSQL